MNKKAWTAHNVAALLLAGPWTEGAIAATLAEALGPGAETRKPLIAAVASLAAGYPPDAKRLAIYLSRSEFFIPPRGPHIAAVLVPPQFAPAAPFATLPIPKLTTTGDLAAWLGVTPAQLAFLADQRHHHGRSIATPLQHYRYAFIAKQHGPPRLLEAPKPRLKAIQRQILHGILAHVPVHAAAKGFVAGQSCLTGAQVHASEFVVASFDLAQFFPSIPARRIHGIFRTLGYPHDVARSLTGLTTTITPAAICQRLADPQRAVHGIPHLPQGAPSAPALANLLAFQLDRRLAGLARAAGANYTRYADDLAFSGSAAFAARLPSFAASITAIVQEEGFALNPAKTRIMPRHTCQRVTGIIVNAHCNTARTAFETLKATLHNCARHGPAGQNRADALDFRRHLDGSIAWTTQINPARGAKLRKIFDRIAWEN